MEQQTTERLLITREIVIDARPETVWEFLVDPEKLRRWKATEADFVATPGAEYRIAVTPARIALGEVVEVDPPHRLVYTWGWEGCHDDVPPGSSTLEYTLEPEGSGTRLRLVHSGLPNAEAFEAHSMGWDHYLARLEIVVPGGDPGPDPWAQPRPDAS